jgi:amidase
MALTLTPSSSTTTRASEGPKEPPAPCRLPPRAFESITSKLRSSYSTLVFIFKARAACRSSCRVAVAHRRGRVQEKGVPRLFEYNAASLAALIRSREVSSREVVEAHLARIDELNDYLGAIAVTLRDSALAAADVCDRMDPGGPLHGVPFTVKEDIDCLGSATTHGLPALRDAQPYLDAPVVARLKAAGAIVLGRTNMSEMGLRLCTDNPLRGRTLNPYDRRRTVGGSSGGDAAAVATGMVPLGIGGDIGGSLRVPAQCCGVATLKPTTGRIAQASSLDPRDQGMAGQAMLALGPLARSVLDLRLSLSILAGRDIRDPRSVDAPLQGTEPLERRAALVTELPGGPLDAATLASITRAGQLLQAAGWEVEEAVPPELTAVNDVFSQLLATDLSVLTPQLRPFISDALFEHLLRICRSSKLPEVSNYRLHTERSRLTRAWSGFFSEYPVVVGPNWGCPVWPIDADLNLEFGIELLERTVRFITPGNALGFPCLALPMGVTDGAPCGVQIYADLWREDLCLAAAEVIERGVKMPSPIDPVRGT